MKQKENNMICIELHHEQHEDEILLVDDLVVE
jgi:hypothetical protein